MTKLEIWLVKLKKHDEDKVCDCVTAEGKIHIEAIAVIEKLKEALEHIDNFWVDYELSERSSEAQYAHEALAIDPDSLLRNSNNGEKE